MKITFKELLRLFFGCVLIFILLSSVDFLTYIKEQDYELLWKGFFVVPFFILIPLLLFFRFSRWYFALLYPFIILSSFLCCSIFLHNTYTDLNTVSVIINSPHTETSEYLRTFGVYYFSFGLVYTLIFILGLFIVPRQIPFKRALVISGRFSND